MKYKILVLSVLISLSASSIVLASEIQQNDEKQLKMNEIDLSSLSDDLKATHSHRLVQRYDDKNHWKACIDCEYTSEKIEHTMLAKVEVVNTSTCLTDNDRIRYCNDNCGYYRLEPVSSQSYIDEGWHRPSGTKHTIINGVPTFYKICNDCHKLVYKSMDGWEYTLNGGGTADASTVKHGDTVLFRAMGHNSTTKIEEISIANHGISNVDLQYELEDTGEQFKTLNMTLSFEIPDNIKDWDESKLLNDKYIYPYVYVIGTPTLVRTPRGMNSNDKKIEGNKLIAKFSTQIRDDNLDFIDEVKIRPNVQVRIPVEGYTYRRFIEEYYGNEVSFTTNFTDPSIESAGF